MLKRILREPLLHFLLLGALVFAAYGVLNPEASRVRDNVIRVSAGTVERLSDAWRKQWQRVPTESELAGLVEGHIREEVLYREALAMGLDRDDVVIRRRLAQKMDFLTEDLAERSKPTDSQLREFFAANTSLFSEPAQITFSHVYFNSDERGAAALEQAKQLAARLRSGEADDPAALGDRFLLERDLGPVSEVAVAASFGREFAAALFALPTGEWSDPIPSGFGLHLVRISEHRDERIPAFDEVRGDVLDRYAAREREAIDEAVYQRLRARYEITVEAPNEAAGHS